MTRPTHLEMFMEMARIAAKRSSCMRAQVGCIITNLDGTSIVSMGYNGNARGLPDHCDSEVPGECGCIHAEENALLKAPYGKALVMYTTTSPCLSCAKRILNSSVIQIFFDLDYRATAGKDLLNAQGLSCLQYESFLARKQ